MMRLRAAISLPVALSVSILTSGCDTLKNGSSEEIGTAAAAAVCGTAGAYFGGNLPAWAQAVTTAGGAFICGYIGKQIGSLLDEQDRQQANDAAQQALATGKVQSWSNPQTNVSGKSRVVATSSQQTDKGRRPCKTVQNSVTLADGKSTSEDMLVCKGRDGQWEPQSDTVTASGPAPADSSATGEMLDTAKEKASDAIEAIEKMF